MIDHNEDYPGGETHETDWLSEYIAEHSAMGYIWLDLQGNILAYNARAGTMVRAGSDDLRGSPLRELVVAGDRHRFDATIDSWGISSSDEVPVCVGLEGNDGGSAVQATIRRIPGDDSAFGFLVTVDPFAPALNAQARHGYNQDVVVKSIQEQASRESALRQLVDHLNSTLDSDRILQIVADTVFEQVTNSLTLVATRSLDSGNLITRVIKDGEPATTTDERTRVRAVSERAFTHRQQQHISNAGHSRRSGDGQTPVIRAILATPILDAIPVDDKTLETPICLGVLTATRTDSDRFSEDEQRMLQLAANIAGTASRNAWLYESRLQQTHDLAEVQRIGSLVATSLDVDQTAQQVVNSVLDIFEDVEHCAIRVVDQDNLRMLAAAGPNAHRLPPIISRSTHLLWQVARQGELLAIHDIHQLDPERHQRHPLVRGALIAPLVDHDGTSFGLITVHSPHPRHWSERERSLLMTMANTVSIAITNAREFEQTRNTLHALVESLAAAIDAKDPNTHNHSRNVAHYARQTALAMNLTDDQVTYIELAGLLHDVGKVGVPDRILLKQLPLTTDERATMQSHPLIGERILSGHPNLKPILALVRHHHENWDGSGYPDGLSGQDIPLGASILGLAEAFDTMITDRPYQARQTVDDALTEIQRIRGTQLNPQVVDAFLEGVQNGSITVPATAGLEIEPVTSGTMFGDELGQDAQATLLFHSIAAEVRALDDLDTFLANIARTIRDVLGKPYVQIFATNDSSGELFHLVTLFRDQLLPPPQKPRHVSEGITGWAVRHGQMLNVPDVEADVRFRPPRRQGVRVRSELAVPLISEERVIGVINIESEEVGAFTSVDEQLMTAAANLLAQVIETARVIDRIRQLATTDGLTGLANHRTFYERLEQEMQQAGIPGENLLAIAIFDVDQLKRINDTYGHLAGDSALRTIARTIQCSCRWTDLVCRYGGDEFAIIMPATNAETAWYILDRIDTELARATFSTGETELPLPGGSWGIAIYPTEGQRPAELVNVADRQMYRNKLRRQGR